MMGRKSNILFLFVTLLAFGNVFAQETTPELVNQGVAYGKEGRYDEAIASLTKAVELNPNDSKAFNNRGLAYFYKGQFTQALSDYNKAIELDPNFAEAYSNRGFVQSDIDQAILDFTKAIDLNPKLAQSYSNRAVVYYAKREYDKSWVDVHKAEELGYQVNPRFLEELKKTSGRKN
jgi:Flp pilus assembly protein TadD